MLRWKIAYLLKKAYEIDLPRQKCILLIMLNKFSK